MAFELLPTTREIRAAAVDELDRYGGTVADCFEDGGRLFLRAVLPTARRVLPGDAIQGGVALMTAGEEIAVHPYTFRQVCRNGAIHTEIVGTETVFRVDFAAPTETIEGVLVEVREAVRLCAEPEALTKAVHQMRSAAESNAAMALDVAAFMTSHGQRFPVELIDSIRSSFSAGRDRSLFGLMNAVTATARDERDPEVRWRLEELGGAVAALVRPRRRPSGAARSGGGELAAVGAGA